MIDLDAIYFAGFFDGEGYIGLQKRQRGKYTEHFLMMSFGQKDGAIIDWVKENFGGHAHLVKRDGSYFWIATNQNAYKTLSRIVPYLKYKRPQAELALEFYDKRPKQRSISTEELQRRDELLAKLKLAKRIFEQSIYCVSGAATTTKRTDPKGV